MTFVCVVAVAIIGLVLMSLKLYSETSKYSAQLQSSLKKKTIETNKTRAQLSVLKTNYTKVEENNGQLSAQNKVELKEKKEAENKVIALKKELKKSQNENNFLKKFEEELQKEAQDNRSQIENLITESNLLKERIESSENDNKHKSNLINKIEQDSKKKDSRILEVEDKIKKTLVLLKKAEQDSANKSNKIKTIEKENNVKLDLMNNLEKKYKITTDHLNQRQQESQLQIEQLQAANKKLLSEAQENITENKSLNNEIDKLNQEYQEQQNSLHLLTQNKEKELKEHHLITEENLKIKTNEIKSFEEALHRERRITDQKNKEISLLKQSNRDLTQAQVELNEQIQKLEAKIVEYHQVNTSLQTEVENRKEQIESRNTEIDRTKIQNLNYEKDLSATGKNTKDIPMSYDENYENRNLSQEDLIQELLSDLKLKAEFEKKLRKRILKAHSIILSLEKKNIALENRFKMLEEQKQEAPNDNVIPIKQPSPYSISHELALELDKTSTPNVVESSTQPNELDFLKAKLDEARKSLFKIQSASQTEDELKVKNAA